MVSIIVIAFNEEGNTGSEETEAEVGIVIVNEETMMAITTQRKQTERKLRLFVGVDKLIRLCL